jgi:hypothetical protein
MREVSSQMGQNRPSIKDCLTQGLNRDGTVTFAQKTSSVQNKFAAARSSYKSVEPTSFQTAPDNPGRREFKNRQALSNRSQEQHSDYNLNLPTTTTDHN